MNDYHSEFADVLNELDAMQQAMAYAIRWPTLRRAEHIIVQLEQETRDLRATVLRLQAIKTADK